MPSKSPHSTLALFGEPAATNAGTATEADERDRVPVEYVSVALPIPLGQAFTYAVSTTSPVRRGCRVVVPLGRRRVLGVVLERRPAPPAGLELSKLKPVTHLVDEVPTLDEELLSFLLELARYYVAPIGEVLRLAMPALERATAGEIEKLSGLRAKSVGRLVQLAVRTDVDPSALEKPLRPRQETLLRHLNAHGPTPVTSLVELDGNARAIVKRLVELALVRLETTTKESDPFFSEPLDRDAPKALNAEQSAALARIEAALASDRPASFLLDGVTASGKTEVYLRAAERTLALGRGVIVLVPEIALTPQLVGRFRARLGDELAVLHSGLTESERHAMWRRLRSGEVRLAIGARSALFAPVANLGLVCVDEEHDPSYKQEEGVRYHARDMARLRAHRARAVVVLGSATPSLATEYAARTNKLERLVLRTRAKTSSTLPSVELVDLNRIGPGPSGDPLLSVTLHRALEANLERGRQSILFLNRRGFAPSLVCGACGAIATCPNCAVALTVHRKGGARLECHYCGHRENLPGACGECGGPEIVEEGLGTERVEALLTEQFPRARVGRLDRDVGAGLSSEGILDRMRRGELDILVGTQMVTKGHDLPNVTLVGVLNADSALSLPDFRAAERTFHQLVQVAGRAGRDSEPGRVLIQTRTPSHPAIHCAVHHDVRGFYEQELALREEVAYPPFTHLALLRLDGLDESVVRRAASDLAHRLEKNAGGADILGPAPAPISKLGNRYRFRILLRAVDRAMLRPLLLEAARAPLSSKVRLALDVDPMSLL